MDSGRVVGVKIILSARQANGSALGNVGLPAPLQTRHIPARNDWSLHFGIVRIINKGAPRIIEARARGTRLEMRNGNLCTGK